MRGAMGFDVRSQSEHTPKRLGYPFGSVRVLPMLELLSCFEPDLYLLNSQAARLLLRFLNKNHYSQRVEFCSDEQL